jgi:hypothetical protein
MDFIYRLIFLGVLLSIIYTLYIYQKQLEDETNKKKVIQQPKKNIKKDTLDEITKANTKANENTRILNDECSLFDNSLTNVSTKLDSNDELTNSDDSEESNLSSLLK